VQDVYPPGFDTSVRVGAVAQPLEGAARPGHFDGVATVVALLFALVGAEHAYFGQKDAQQVVVIRQLVRDLNFPVELVVCPTVRESDGLAMSSRNVYLTQEQRAAAPVLFRALSGALGLWEKGERDGGRLRQVMRRILDAEPLADPEYVSAADPLTLDELGTASRGVLLSMAVRIGKARLIDNLLLEEG
jgi:pantoate--beta-alanine ligase